MTAMFFERIVKKIDENLYSWNEFKKVNITTYDVHTCGNINFHNLISGLEALIDL